MKMGGESSLPHYYGKLLEQRGVEVWLACHERVREEVLAQFPGIGNRLRFIENSRIQRGLLRSSSLVLWKICRLERNSVPHTCI